MPVLGVFAVVCVGGVVVVLREVRRVVAAHDVSVRSGGRAAVLLLLAVDLRVDWLPGSDLQRGTRMTSTETA